MSGEETTRWQLDPCRCSSLGFAEPNFTGKIAAELDRLREHEFVKIVDALVVNKDDDGDITALQVSDLSQDEATEMGAMIGALIGFGYGDRRGDRRRQPSGAEAMADGHLIPDEEAWYVADAIPNGTAAAIILLEHLWAIPLRDAIIDAGGIALADEWIHPKDLIAVGVAAPPSSSRAGVGVAASTATTPTSLPSRIEDRSAWRAPRRSVPGGLPGSTRAACAAGLPRGAAGVRGIDRCARRRRRLRLPQARGRGTAICLRDPARRPRVRHAAGLVADPVLALTGVSVALTIQLLPGEGGHEPSAGLSATGVPAGNELPAVAIAAFVTLGLGVVLGPEAPLIAIGGGLAASPSTWSSGTHRPRPRW